MNEAQIFALVVGERYGIKDVLKKCPELADISDDAGKELDVLKLILMPDEMVDYLLQDKKDKRNLREKYNMQPYDLFDSDYDELIKQYSK